MRKGNGGIVLGVLLSAFMFIPAGSGPSQAWAEQRPGLAIIPFLAVSIDDPARGAVCPICRGVYGRGNIPLGAPDTLTRLLQQKMESSSAFRVIPPEKVEEALAAVGRAALEEKPAQSSLRIAKDLDAPFVMAGFVFRFDERIGSSMGVDRPASVGFDLHLTRVRDGKVVWTGKFDETQRPLSDDLRQIGSFLRRGAVWLTAAELASDGMNELLKKLPDPVDLEK